MPQAYPRSARERPPARSGRRGIATNLGAGPSTRTANVLTTYPQGSRKSSISSASWTPTDLGAYILETRECFRDAEVLSGFIKQHKFTLPGLLQLEKRDIKEVANHQTSLVQDVRRLIEIFRPKLHSPVQSRHPRLTDAFPHLPIPTQPHPRSSDIPNTSSEENVSDTSSFIFSDDEKNLKSPGPMPTAGQDSPVGDGVQQVSERSPAAARVYLQSANADGDGASKPEIRRGADPEIPAVGPARPVAPTNPLVSCDKAAAAESQPHEHIDDRSSQAPTHASTQESHEHVAALPTVSASSDPGRPPAWTSKENLDTISAQSGPSVSSQVGKAWPPAQEKTNGNAVVPASDAAAAATPTTSDSTNAANRSTSRPAVETPHRAPAESREITGSGERAGNGSANVSSRAAVGGPASRTVRRRGPVNTEQRHAGETTQSAPTSSPAATVESDPTTAEQKDTDTTQSAPTPTAGTTVHELASAEQAGTDAPIPSPVYSPTPCGSASTATEQRGISGAADAQTVNESAGASSVMQDQADFIRCATELIVGKLSPHEGVGSVSLDKKQGCDALSSQQVTRPTVQANPVTGAVHPENADSQSSSNMVSISDSDAQTSSAEPMEDSSSSTLVKEAHESHLHATTQTATQDGMLAQEVDMSADQTSITTDRASSQTPDPKSLASSDIKTTKASNDTTVEISSTTMTGEPSEQPNAYISLGSGAQQGAPPVQVESTKPLFKEGSQEVNSPAGRAGSVNVERSTELQSSGITSDSTLGASTKEPTRDSSAAWETQLSRKSNAQPIPTSPTQAIISRQDTAHDAVQSQQADMDRSRRGDSVAKPPAETPVAEHGTSSQVAEPEQDSVNVQANTSPSQTSTIADAASSPSIKLHPSATQGAASHISTTGETDTSRLQPEGNESRTPDTQPTAPQEELPAQPAKLLNADSSDKQVDDDSACPPYEGSSTGQTVTATDSSSNHPFLWQFSSEGNATTAPSIVVHPTDLIGRGAALQPDAEKAEPQTTTEEEIPHVQASVFESSKGQANDNERSQRGNGPDSQISAEARAMESRNIDPRSSEGDSTATRDTHNSSLSMEITASREPETEHVATQILPAQTNIKRSDGQVDRDGAGPLQEMNIGSQTANAAIDTMNSVEIIDVSSTGEGTSGVPIVVNPSEASVTDPEAQRSHLADLDMQTEHYSVIPQQVDTVISQEITITDVGSSRGADPYSSLATEGTPNDGTNTARDSTMGTPQREATPPSLDRQADGDNSEGCHVDIGLPRATTTEGDAPDNVNAISPATPIPAVCETRREMNVEERSQGSATNRGNQVSDGDAITGTTGAIEPAGDMSVTSQLLAVAPIPSSSRRMVNKLRHVPSLLLERVAHLSFSHPFSRRIPAVASTSQGEDEYDDDSLVDQYVTIQGEDAESASLRSDEGEVDGLEDEYQVPIADHERHPDDTPSRRTSDSPSIASDVSSGVAILDVDHDEEEFEISDTEEQGLEIISIEGGLESPFTGSSNLDTIAGHEGGEGYGRTTQEADVLVAAVHHDNSDDAEPNTELPILEQAGEGNHPRWEEIPKGVFFLPAPDPTGSFLKEPELSPLQVVSSLTHFERAGSSTMDSTPILIAGTSTSSPVQSTSFDNRTPYSPMSSRREVVDIQPHSRVRKQLATPLVLHERIFNDASMQIKSPTEVRSLVRPRPPGVPVILTPQGLSGSLLTAIASSSSYGFAGLPSPSPATDANPDLWQL
ncbi:hypothetical protein SCP_1801600 [Sparassis crispa]|uniref:Uncharacterized protein n=1 Tax=Sparassis crispa TaxID=139825 RepID=A0A401H6R7_9APHY|nr:hypothetical protein SCP_1801600 [Sparassis crispa]GBE90136.1 hypothetical protein SCP_1801600 [Sparassis crispa]